jgi:hypothetical protein
MLRFQHSHSMNYQVQHFTILIEHKKNVCAFQQKVIWSM